MKCPKCGYPRARYSKRKTVETKRDIAKRDWKGRKDITTVTDKSKIGIEGYCPKCKHTWKETDED